LGFKNVAHFLLFIFFQTKTYHEVLTTPAQSRRGVFRLEKNAGDKVLLKSTKFYLIKKSIQFHTICPIFMKMTVMTAKNKL